ncbi:MAG: response regulator [Phycisphaerales bacterium]|nr:response regulator [Phycisphaerales bacterium]
MRDDEIDALLDALEGPPGAEAKREDRRYPYRIRGMPLYVQHPGAHAPIGYRVPTRNISAEGLSFLHGGFLHNGTRCRVQLLTTYGTWTNVDCAVSGCRHLRGNVHEISVKFERPIDPSQHARCAHRMQILLAEDGNLVAKLARHYFEQMNAHVTHVPDGAQAVTLAKSHEFDIVLVDIHMPVLDGLSATKQLREGGYTGWIVAMSGDATEATKNAARAVGCNHFMAKPFKKDDLAKLLDLVRDEPLVSTLYDDPEMRPLIDAYLTQLATQVRSLETALAGEDLDAMAALLRDLKGEGSSYGFELLTQKAGNIANNLEAGKSIADLRTDLIGLIKLCHLAHASAKQDGSAASADAGASNAAADVTGNI